MIDYKEKIKKLLALSQSPVEAEATAALTKARELMAKYKIEQSEINGISDEDMTLVSSVMWDIPFFSRKDLWLVNIFALINDYFPVLVSARCHSQKKTKYPTVSGYTNDVKIVEQLIRYIYESVYTWTKKNSKQRNISSKAKQSIIREGYGYGFYIGWESALKEQNKDNPEWGLVLVKPDVSSVTTVRGNYTPKYETSIDRQAYVHGIRDGNSFATKKRIEERS